MLPILAGCAQLLATIWLFAVDHQIAGWFHARLTHLFAHLLLAMSAPGSATWIAIVLSLAVPLLAWKRRWHRLAWLILTLPGGMLLGELLKLLVHRHRPYLVGPFVDWSGYSFPSGHTIGATLLYGVLIAAILPRLTTRHWRACAIAAGVILILLVGFSRIALGAHYLTDVLAAIVLGSVWLALCSTLLHLRLAAARRTGLLAQQCSNDEIPEQAPHPRPPPGDCRPRPLHPTAP